MKKTLKISHDPSTWPPGSSPAPGLVSYCGAGVSIDVFGALLMTAVVTRPPSIGRFHLSDFWAWIRYFHALSQTNDLRLSNAYLDLDPHQKTILSDDWGMGFATFALSNALSVQGWAQTYDLARLHPKAFQLTSKGKRGPAKSPDFVGITPSGSLVILECKGSQGLATLPTILSNGRLQKRSLIVHPSLQVEETLVSGLYIAAHGSQISSELSFIDPPIIRSEEFSSTAIDSAEIRRTIFRHQLASTLMLMGLALPAQEMMNPVGDHWWRFSREALNGIEESLRGQNPGAFRFSLGNPLGLSRGYIPLTGEIGIDPNLLEILLATESHLDPFLRYRFEELVEIDSAEQPKSDKGLRDNNLYSKLRLPCGARLAVTCSLHDRDSRTERKPK